MNTDLTTQEQQHVRAASGSSARAWAAGRRSRRCSGSRTRSLSAVATSNKSVSTTLAFRIARFAKVEVDG